jgi:hypothetical protein
VPEIPTRVLFWEAVSTKIIHNGDKTKLDKTRKGKKKNRKEIDVVMKGKKSEREGYANWTNGK